MERFVTPFYRLFRRIRRYASRIGPEHNQWWPRLVVGLFGFGKEYGAQDPFVTWVRLGRRVTVHSDKGWAQNE
jgi:hypothetical protein